MVDAPEKLAEFRRKYNFLEDVEVRYCPEDEALLSRGEDRVVLSLVAVVEGGVRILMREEHAFKKKRQLINSTDLNRLLRSPIYPHPDSQLHTAYLILGYSLVYRSFQDVGKAITLKHLLLPYIDLRCKGYTLSPFESAHQEEGRYRSNSPPPSFTPKDLGVTITIPTLSDRPRRQRKKKTNSDTTEDPFPPHKELIIPAAIPLDNPSIEMTLQRSRVTLA
nr:hypothetical protein CFP56_18188 [Quercus suber]